jgi:hypothetical protein
VRRNLFAAFCRERAERLFSYREHAAGAACAVIKEIGARGNLIRDGHEDELCHEFYGVARRPVFAGFLVVRLIEPADEFLEDCPHRVVVEARMFH